MNRLLALLSVIAVLVPAARARGENWPQWRGPRNDGLSSEKAPLKWSRTENVAWRLPLPGRAGSTPVVWGDRIFLTSASDGDELLLLCVSTEGKKLWEKVVGGGNQNVRRDEGNYASPSPSTDGKHVWTAMSNGLLACYNVSGDLEWRVDLQERYGKFEIQFGLSSTPVLHGDRLYLQLIHGKWSKTPSRGLVVALDKATGKEVWKKVRATAAVDECKHSYASPVLYQDDQRAFFVSHGADWTIAHDLETGEEIWRCGGLNPVTPGGRYHNTLRFVASPVAVPGLIVVPTAKNGGVVAIDPTSGKGDLTGTKSVRWIARRVTPDVPSPLVHDGLVYLSRDGSLVVLDAATGKQYYEERVFRSRYRASPLYSDGRIYLTARRGVVTVVKAGREFEVLAENKMDEPITASPLISGGTLYLRTFDALYAIREKK